MICCSPARHGLLPASDFLLLNTYTPRCPASPRKVSYTRPASPTLTPARSCLTRRYPSLRTTSADTCTRARTILTLRCSLRAQALVMQDVTTGRTLRQLMLDAAMDAKRKTRRKNAYMHASYFPNMAGYSSPQRRVLFHPHLFRPLFSFLAVQVSGRLQRLNGFYLFLSAILFVPHRSSSPSPKIHAGCLHYTLYHGRSMPAIHTRSDVVVLTSAPLPPQSHSPSLGLISCPLYSTVV